MNQLNQIILEGNLVRDAELVQTSVCEVLKATVAVDRFYKNKDGETVKEVSYFHIEAYGILAERIGSKCKKGRAIRVIGRLKQNRWKDSDGKEHSIVLVIAEHIDFKPDSTKEVE